MAIEIGLTSVFRNNGTIYARFDDNTELEITVVKLRERIRELEDDVNLLRMLTLGFLLKRSNDASDQSSLAGRKVVFDLAHANPVRTRIV